ncbi:CD166 antigen-like isoform X2 [Colossoma macropomum]|uniref:CD166 antigen-like isoform X2 n=1 Tax=Colossoma macropomum TaxID=42526 RepID=UPI001863ABBE|nr:CD166 antigen-like isoform X2 [Colossoma macropomum]
MCEGILLRIFLGFLYLYSNVAGTLWLDPPKVVVRHGDSVSVNCSTNVTDQALLDWEKPQGYTKDINDKKVTWTVEHLTEWGMKPFCYMTDANNNQDKIELNIIIYKTPDRVSISTVGPMIEGEQYELQCDIQNVAPVEFLTVSWYKGDTLVKNITFTDPIKTPVNLSDTLQISPSRDDDGAQYRCEAELDLGPEGPQPPPTVTSDPLTITVYYGPEISCSSHVTLEEGEMFTPSCSAEGNPPPEMTWYKEGERVDFPQRMNRNNAGQYILTVISSSTVHHTLEVEMLYPPVSISELHDKSVDFGYDEVLKCSSDARPHPQYRWEYIPAPNVRTNNTDGVSLLYIDYATGLNTGTYKCTASNKLGETSQSVRVDVKGTHDRVSIETVGHTGPMIEDREYELRCIVEYVAPVRHVEVSWYKGGERVKSASIGDTETTKSNKTWSHDLTVSHNRAENGTQYKCEAKVIKTSGGPLLLIGKSAPLNIIVHYKPVINKAKLPSDVPVFRGYPETLVCEAEGYPPPTITWSLKPNTEVKQGHLTIMEATNENVGEYKCTASNSVGTTFRTVTVTMKEDYLPLIAGFVALVVVITSVIFVIIYSIYYKNTKMGRYSVEGAKPNAQNGNVAQNGKDSSIPMKKLSQNSICV